MKHMLLGAVALSSLLASTAAAKEDPCIGCHELKTPGIVQYWKNSAHFIRKVGCTSCHGGDVEANHKRERIVDAVICGSCHRAAYTAHRLSKHSMGLRAGKACTRNMEESADQKKSCTLCHEPGSAVPFVNVECALFLAQTPEMQEQGCNACHVVEARCDSCHTKHGTDLDLARDPNTCGACHMGPDHPQLEMWETSRHGVIYKKSGPQAAPSCVSCHMPKGSHNVSRGISSGLTGTGNAKKQEREFMLTICGTCHTRNFAARNLDDGDSIERQSKALVAEAQQLIDGLQKEGLLSPTPAERPPHPLFGKNFVLGPHMLYENLSSVESIFFKMKAFYAISAYKGVFHQNPDYAHWYGNAPLKLALSEIRSEAALLRKVELIKKRVDNLGGMSSDRKNEVDDIKQKLRMLNEKRLKGELSEKEYEKTKGQLLDEKGL
jgi:hypothetical protein